MRKKKRQFRYILLVLILLFISMGYAFLNTTLNIVGVSSINNPTWDIHFENVVVKSGSVLASTPTIDTNKTTVNFSVELSLPGDYYEFTVDVVNDGSIDGMISVISNKLNNVEITTLPNYLEYVVSYVDDIDISLNHLLVADSSETYKVRVGYKKDLTAADLPSTSQTLNFSFSVIYVQSDDTAVEKPVASFENHSWTTIVRNVKNNTIPDFYTLGSTKTVSMGSFGTHTIRIANTSTPTECSTAGFSQTACGFVLEFVDVVTRHQMNPYNSGDTTTLGVNSKGGWEYSELRTYTNTNIYNALPEELRNGIIDTLVVSGHGSRDSNNFITTDKLYVLDAREVYGTTFNDSYNTARSFERQLDYYLSVGVTTSNYSGVVKRQSGTARYWWLRSAGGSSSSNFYSISGSGTWDRSNSNNNNGVSPAFRIG